jgi:two-component system response regulator RegX3
MNNTNHFEVATKNHSGQYVGLTDNIRNGRSIAKILVICDQEDTAPLWGYILRQQGLLVSLETHMERAIDRWSAEMPDLIVIDVDKHDPLELCTMFRTVSVAPILLFLPAYNEAEIVKAYAAGVDDVLVKPVSHTIFVPKIRAWMRRTWVMPTDGLKLVKAGKYELVPRLRSIVGPDDVKIQLTNLEFRLLHLLMSQPGCVFMAEDIVQSIWGGYENGDNMVLKNVVYRLRRKIEKDPGNPVLIKTLHGGYSFQG